MSTDNPYKSPTAVTAASAERSPDHQKIVRNIRAICSLYVLLGLVAILASIALFSSASGEIPSWAAGLVFVLGLGGVISAVGVLRRKAWGVPFCQVVSAFYLLNFPIGTVLGGYFLLNIRKVRDDFR